MARLAILGDIHGALVEGDISSLNGGDADLILIVGDLGLSFHARTLFEPALVLAERLSRLTKPALFVLGNHDGTTLAQIVAEVLGRDFLIEIMSVGMAKRVARLVEVLEGGAGNLRVGGYSLHEYDLGGPGGRFDVVVGRPHSMGGPSLGFRPFLTERFGVRSLDDSAAKLIELVERSEAEAILFLAHNGPTGLGAARDDIWGRDFGRREGDWGDGDLELALRRAKELGKRVIAVVAGHMHLGLNGGGERPWQREHEGVLHINAARVPRLIRRGEVLCRHHFSLLWDGREASVEEIVIEAEVAEPRCLLRRLGRR